MVRWFVFYHGERELAAMTVQGSFLGEIAATVALLAGERGIPPESIRVAVEDRPLRSSVPVQKKIAKTAK